MQWEAADGHKWPGNVRQLVDVIEQCVALTSSPVIGDALVEQAWRRDTALPTFVEARNQFEAELPAQAAAKLPRATSLTPRGWRGASAPNSISCCRAVRLDANDIKSSSALPGAGCDAVSKTVTRLGTGTP